MEIKRKLRRDDFKVTEDGRKVLTRQGFETMIVDSLQNVMNNAHNRQGRLLEPMFDRLTSDEFDKYLAEERAKILKHDGWREYDYWKQNGIPTFQSLAFIIAQGIEEKEQEEINWNDHWTKSAWINEVFVQQYFRGLELEGSLAAITDFRDSNIQLTFEDWKSGNWPAFAYPVSYTFHRHLSRGDDGRYRFYYLSEEEFKRIAGFQEGVFKNLVDTFLKGQIMKFEEDFAKSEEPEELIETELKRLKKWTSKKNRSGALGIPKPNGGMVIFSDVLHSLIGKEGENRNKFPEWHDKIIKYGNDARAYIKPEHENELSLPYPVAVHVLNRYKKYLLHRLIENPPVIDLWQKEETPSTEIRKASQKVLALFYLYQHMSGVLPRFAASGKTKTEEIDEIAARHDVSAKNFETTYNSLNKKIQDERVDNARLVDFEAAVSMLSDVPEAQKLAMQDFERKKEKKH